MGRFLFGVIIGGMAAFLLGYNFGRGVPLLTDPLAARSGLPAEMKTQASEILESARAAIHKATAPSRRPGIPPPGR
ncbi:MAG: hypothetical protein M0Z84_09395 [Gammaproteobacteria bacterium]|nr:hypothetical protein [Gammaproteobacteria bacterium]